MILALVLLLQDASKIAQEIEYANAKEKPQLHVQAVRRLRDRGGPAVADEIGKFVAKQGHNGLSIAFTEGLALANVDSVDIIVKGKGGHGAAPHATIDPIVLSARIILDLQTIVTGINPGG